MKIVQVIPHLKLGGAEVMCENLSYELVNQGHDVVVISLYSIETPISLRLKDKNIRVVFLNKKNGLDFNVIKTLREILRKENPDVIHTHLYSLKYVFLSTLFLKDKKKIIHTIHNVAEKECTKFDRIINKSLFKHRKSIPVALSEEIKKTIHDLYHLNIDSIPVIYNGVALNKLIPKKTYDISNKTVFTHVGRFFEQKNHSCLIKTFAKYYKINNNCELRLIGIGEKMEEMKELAKNLYMDDAIIFYGQREDIPELLNESDIFVFPSVYEGIPIALIEAMGTGLPIIASEVGGIKDMLKNNESAILITPNENELLEALTKLAENSSLREKIGTSAKKASIKFSASNMAEEYIKLYEKCF